MNNDPLNNQNTSPSPTPPQGPMPMNSLDGITPRTSPMAPQQPVTPTPVQPAMTPTPQQTAVNDFVNRPRPTVPRNPNFENAKQAAQDAGFPMGAAQPTVMVAKKSKAKLILLILLVIVLLAGAAAGYLFLTKKKSTKTSSASTANTSTQAVTFNTWTGKGSSNNFSDSANWSNGTPVNGQNLEINLSTIGTTSTSSANSSSSSAVVSSSPQIKNDINNLSVGQIKIDGTSDLSSFQLAGNALTINNSLQVTAKSSTPNMKINLNVPINLGGNSNFQISGNSVVTFVGSATNMIDLSTFNLSFNVSNTATVLEDMSLSGKGDLTMASSAVSTTSSLKFMASSPNYSGKVEVGANDLVALGYSSPSNAFGTGAITVDNGGALELVLTTGNAFNLGNDLNLSGNGVKNGSSNALGAYTGALTGCIVNAAGLCTAGLNVALSGMDMLNANTELGALYLPSAGAILKTASVTYHFTNLMKNNFTVSPVASSQAVIN